MENKEVVLTDGQLKMGNSTAFLDLLGDLKFGGGVAFWRHPLVYNFMEQMKRKSPFVAVNCLMSDRCLHIHDYGIYLVQNKSIWTLSWHESQLFHDDGTQFKPYPHLAMNSQPTRILDEPVIYRTAFDLLLERKLSFAFLTPSPIVPIFIIFTLQIFPCSLFIKLKSTHFLI